ncbi:hypothetical protein BAE44_0013557 [Dichanthelium oligosanthes]|uniref:Uncharacterized protein n=1 Tax=Dichanthelium oligosanthes TaxID=888268 RepID=A0A1E5VJV9_9POAL|nr:hypothetical protein BAE44_0013557 [Dichanthelium oligosanthes]
MSHDHFLRLLDLHADEDPFFPSSTFSSCPFSSSSSSSSAHHRSPLDDYTSCPLGFTFPSPIDTFHLDLDLLLPPRAAAPPCPAFDPFLLDALGHRVSAIERALAPPPSPAPRRKYTYAAEAHGRKLKWVAEDKPAGGRTYKWEAELKTPNDDGFDRKWKWESKPSAAGTTKVKWAKEIKGKGWLEPWSNSYSVEETYGDDDHHEQDKEKKNTATAALNKVKEEKKDKKNKGNVEIVEIEDNTAGCVAIRKGPDYMVRNAKRSMLEELEGMLEIVDPQPPGKPRTLSRRKFDLPEGGAIPKEMRDGVKNVVRIVEEGK